MQFEWDPKKYSKNLNKHGISFHEAITVFRDPFSLTVEDELHSWEEDRFVTLGESDKNRLMVISHTDRQERIRIINARGPTRSERKFYEEKKRHKI